MALPNSGKSSSLPIPPLQRKEGEMELLKMYSLYSLCTGTFNVMLDIAGATNSSAVEHAEQVMREMFHVGVGEVEILCGKC